MNATIPVTQENGTGVRVPVHASAGYIQVNAKVSTPVPPVTQERGTGVHAVSRKKSPVMFLRKTKEVRAKGA